jgi:hypothetical protein
MKKYYFVLAAFVVLIATEATASCFTQDACEKKIDCKSKADCRNKFLATNTKPGMTDYEKRELKDDSFRVCSENLGTVDTCRVALAKELCRRLNPKSCQAAPGNAGGSQGNKQRQQQPVVMGKATSNPLSLDRFKNTQTTNPRR